MQPFFVRCFLVQRARRRRPGRLGGSGVSLFYTPTFFGRTGRLRCFPHVSRATYVPRGVGVVRVDKAGEAFTRQGAPPPAPHAPRRAHAHLPCPSRAPPRAILCPIASQLTACVCPESCRSRRELSNEVLYVYWGRVFCLEMRSKSQNFLPGLRPGPRDETPSPDAPPRRQGAPVPPPSNMYLVIRATGGIRLAASGPVLVQQPAAAGRVRASWQRRAYACGCACCLRKRTPSSMCCASQ